MWQNMDTLNVSLGRAVRGHLTIEALLELVE